MPVDTSSYYPEIPSPSGESLGLNASERDLFAPKPPEDSRQPEESGSHHSDPLPPSEESNDNDLNPSAYPAIDAFSHFLSWVLVPLLMPVYGLLLAFGLSVLEVVPLGMRVRFTFMILGITFGVPVVLVLLLKFLGIVDDVGLNGRKERFLPYIINAICTGGAAWLMASRGAPIWLVMFFTGGAVASVVNLIVNFKWKISAHAAAIAGVVALLIRMEKDAAAQPELFVWLLIAIGLTGLLGSARVWLGRHTLMQVLAGYTVGFCSVFFMMAIH